MEGGGSQNKGGGLKNQQNVLNNGSDKHSFSRF